ncbi:hypothetical protein V8B55DRAFT_1446156 [Mucor lusitanicus]|uniref:Arrestin C-terminal-like domain-containing protein n=1 Tax=Mucor circinelloides f. lusitanicus TaxID=29924 RepID=A0A8H4BPY1_MUCCL|nr:hypothetical protein FB192DRAFT_1362459 [Mucor lusitanicus]
MDKLRSSAKLKIHIESDNLIMYGSSSESAGCVLRGVMSLKLQEPTKIKSIALELVGKMAVTWTEGLGNGHDRLFRDEKSVLNHTWTFLPKEAKLHVMNAGDYTYDFELALPGDLPESTYVPNFYTVQYHLKATIERSTFMPNLNLRKIFYVSRQLLPLTPEFLEPVAISNQWSNKLDYEITLPSKIYTHGDQIPITIRITPLTNSLRVRHLSCTLKEYMICRAAGSAGILNTRPRAHGRVLFSTRDDKFGRVNNAASTQAENFIEWTKVQTIPLPTSVQDLQCDIQNEAIRIRHKIKFVLSLINADGHVSELRAALPITICAVNNSGLPAYEEAWRSLPYDPAAFLALLYQSNNNGNSIQNTNTPVLPSYNSIVENCSLVVAANDPPRYDDIPSCLVSR